jgi:hypothetical protein
LLRHQIGCFRIALIADDNPVVGKRDDGRRVLLQRRKQPFYEVGFPEIIIVQDSENCTSCLSKRVVVCEGRPAGTFGTEVPQPVVVEATDDLADDLASWTVVHDYELDMRKGLGEGGLERLPQVIGPIGRGQDADARRLTVGHDRSLMRRGGAGQLRRSGTRFSSRLEVGKVPRYRPGGVTGLFFDAPTPEAVAEAVRQLAHEHWDGDAIRAHAAQFSEQRFVERIWAIVAEEAAR